MRQRQQATVSTAQKEWKEKHYRSVLSYQYLEEMLRLGDYMGAAKIDCDMQALLFKILSSGRFWGLLGWV